MLGGIYYLLDPSTLDNSGTVASEAGYGVTSDFFRTRVINRAGGTIAGGAGGVALFGGGSVINSGTIDGDVDLGDGPNAATGFGSSFVSAGGTLNGNLRFGGANDLLVATDGTTGVTGTIDGGAGIDTYVRRYTASTSVTLGGALPTNFEMQGIEALGAATEITVSAPAGGFASPIAFYGDGTIINRADIASGSADVPNRVTLAGPTDGSGGALAFVNMGSIADGVTGAARSFSNSGTIGSGALAGDAVSLQSTGELAFANSGTIGNDGSDDAAVSISVSDAVRLSATNSGMITGGLSAGATFAPGTVAASAVVTNSGSITALAQDTPALEAIGYTYDAGGSLTLVNSGRISAAGKASTGALIGIFGSGSIGDAPPYSMISIVNNGTIESTGAGVRGAIEIFPGYLIDTFLASVGLNLVGNPGTTATVANGAQGRIAAGAENSVALEIYGTTLELNNAGTISGNAGLQLPATTTVPAYYLAGAIESFDTDDRILARRPVR